MPLFNKTLNAFYLLQRYFYLGRTFYVLLDLVLAETQGKSFKTFLQPVLHRDQAHPTCCGLWSACMRVSLDACLCHTFVQVRAS